MSPEQGSTEMTTTTTQPVLADVPPPARPQKGPRSAARGDGRFSPGRTARYGLLLFFLVVILIPVYVLVVTSFKGPGDSPATPSWNLRTSCTVENWGVAWTTLSPAILRIVAMVVPASIISAMLAS